MNKLTGHGVPSKRLVGEVGQYYEDLDTGDLYECRVASEHSKLHGPIMGGYVWELRAKGEDVKELYGSGGGLPEGGDPHQQLVTDADGVAKWEDRTHYKRDRIKIKLNSDDCACLNGVYNAAHIYDEASPDYNAAMAMSDELDYRYMNMGSGLWDSLTFYWDGVRIYKSPVGRLPLNLNYADLGLSTFRIYQHTVNGKVTAIVELAFTEPGEHTFEYELYEPEIKTLDETFIPTSVPVIQSAQIGQTLVVKAVDENGKPTEWGTANSTFDFNIIKQGSKLVLQKRTFAEIAEASSTGKMNTITPFLSITGMNSDGSTLIIENIPACYFATNKPLGSTELISIHVNFMLSDGAVVKYQINPDDTVTVVTE